MGTAILNLARMEFLVIIHLWVAFCTTFQNLSLFLRYIRSVSSTGNRHLIPTDRVPAVAMNGWHVTRYWSAGVGGGAPIACSPVKSKWRRRLSGDRISSFLELKLS